MTGAALSASGAPARMTMSRQNLHILIGALTVLVGALLIVASYLGDQPGETEADGYRLTASFRAIDGIQPGSEVLLAGVPVGEVEKQYLNVETNNAVVVMRIREGIEIPADSSLKILSEGIAGAKYLKITPGGDFEMLGPGDSFDFTQSAIRFEALLQKLIQSAEARREQAATQDEAAEQSPSDGAQEDGPGGFGLPGLSGD
ncbi:MAG: outer membrane lipid asymmetry maintenance protein MlaD [Marivibrio sp.]|uniref:outer membrane lipid asymmetry maintenance protein MlaD n=1 Tax=Marivibrio sp. TaxID=2039719 RepID=UPI0032ED0B43